MPLVDVPDIGQVSFPDQMSEDDISAAINDHFKQVGVEQSIRATQLPIGIMTNPGVGAAAVGARDYADQERLIKRVTNIPTNGMERAAADVLQFGPPATQASASSALDMISRPVGRTLNTAGRGLVGGLADTGEAMLKYPTLPLDQAMALTQATREPGEPPSNIEALTRGEEMPAISQRRNLPAALRLPLTASQGLIESVPRMAAAAALTPFTGPGAAGALAFGPTEEGFSTKDALIGALLPKVGEWSGGLAERLATKWGLSSEGAAQIINKLGGAAGATATLTADQIQQILRMPEDQRKDAWMDMIGNTAGFLPLSLMGHGGPRIEDLITRAARRGELDRPGSQLETPRGAPIPRGEAPEGLQVNTPEQSAAQALEMTREATATPIERKVGQAGVQNPPRERMLAPRPTVPEVGAEGTTPAMTPEAETLTGLELQIDQVLKGDARTKEQVRSLIPGMSRQQAAGLRSLVWEGPESPGAQAFLESLFKKPYGETESNQVARQADLLQQARDLVTKAKDKYAKRIRSDQGLTGKTGTPPEGGEADSGGNVEQPPPGGPKPVEPGGASQTPGETKVGTDEQVASESTEDLVGRTKVGEERDAAFAARASAIKRVSLSLKPGDIIVDEDGTQRIVRQVAKDGTIFASVDPNEKVGGEYHLGWQDTVKRAGEKSPGKTKVSPAEMIDQAHKAGRVTTNISQEAGRAVTTVADLDELLKKHNEVVAAHKDLMARIRSEKDPIEKAKLMRQGFSDNLNPQYYREAIETATDIMSNSNEADARLGKEPYERPLNWRTHEDAANWVREHAKEIYPDNFGNLPEELQAKPATKADETGATLEPKPGYVRLYNGKGGVAGAGESGAFWTTDLNYARNFGAVSYVDVPQDVFDASQKKMRETGTGGPHVILEDKYVRQAKPMENQPSQTVHDLTPETNPVDEGRNWELFNENVIDNLDSFSPARDTGRHDYEMQDVADRFVAFAKADKSGKPIEKLISDFAKNDEASPSQLRKLRSSVKNVLAAEKIVVTKPAEPGTKASKTETPKSLSSPQEVLDLVQQRKREGKPTYVRVSNSELDLKNPDFKSRIQKRIPDATHEEGMSTLTLYTPDEHLQKFTPRVGELGSSEHIASAFSNFTHLIEDGGGKHVWLVDGDVVGLGYDGEPLLKNAKKIADVSHSAAADLYDQWAKSTGNPDLIAKVAEKTDRIRKRAKPGTKQVLPQAGQDLIETGQPTIIPPEVSRERIVRVLEQLEEETPNGKIRPRVDLEDADLDPIYRQAALAMGMEWGDALKLDHGQLIAKLRKTLGEIESSKLGKNLPPHIPEAPEPPANPTLARLRVLLRDGLKRGVGPEEWLSEFEDIVTGNREHIPDSLQNAYMKLDQAWSKGADENELRSLGDDFAAELAKASGAEVPPRRPAIPVEGEEPPAAETLPRGATGKLLINELSDEQILTLAHDIGLKTTPKDLTIEHTRKAVTTRLQELEFAGMLDSTSIGGTKAEKSAAPPPEPEVTVPGEEPAPVPPNEPPPENLAQNDPRVSQELKDNYAKVLANLRLAEARIPKIEEALKKIEEQRKGGGNTPASLAKLDAKEQELIATWKELREQTGSHGPLTAAVDEAAHAMNWARYQADVGPFRTAPEPPGTQKVFSKDLKAQRDNLMSQVSEALKTAPEENGAEKITFKVPGDGEFTVFNNQTSLKKFRTIVNEGSKSASKFPVQASKPGGPESGGAAIGGRVMPDAKPPKPAKGQTIGQRLAEIIAPFISSDPHRYTLTTSYADGTQIIATDGRRMIRVVTKEAPGSPGKPVRLDSKGKPIEIEGDYPNYNQIWNEKPDLIRGGVDSAELWTVANQAKALWKDAGDRETPFVSLYLNKDGSIGGKSTRAGVGEYEHNLKPDAQIIGRFNPEYLFDSADVSRRLGGDKVDLYTHGGEHAPMEIRGNNFASLLMPMKLGEGEPGKSNFPASKATHGSLPPGLGPLRDPEGPITHYGDKFRITQKDGEYKIEFKDAGKDATGYHEVATIAQADIGSNSKLAAAVAQKFSGKTPQTWIDEARKVLDNIKKERAERVKESTARQTGGVSEALQSFLDRQEAEALARIKTRNLGKKSTAGVDPEELLNFKDYAIIAAAKLGKYGLNRAAWAADVIKTIGPKIKPFLDKLYEAAKEHLAQYHIEIGGKGKPTDVQSVINEAAGVERRPLTSTSAAIDAMQTGLRTVRALQEHFKNAPSVSKAEVKVADDWLEADANRIRDGLTELVKRELPLEERGKFITAINNASKRSPILTGDPEGMYRRAAKLAAKIEDRAQEVRKGAAIADLRTTVNRALASPGVDIGYKNRILDLLKRVSLTKPTEETLSKLKSTRDYLDRMAAEGKDVEMPREILDHLELLTKIPLRDLPLNAVQALADKIGRLEQLGRLKVKARAEAWEIEKRSRMADLPAEATNPLEKRPEFVPQPGDPTPPSIKMRNYLNRLLNAASTIDKAYLPMDAVFDMLGDAKANYRGWLFRNIRGPLDLAFNEYSVLRDQITDPISALVKKYKMGQREAERINTYARAMQEGGIERLVAQGVDPKTIDKIIETFTPAERHVYSEMRKRMDELLPQMQKLMHELYNIDVKPVENYWPLPRDWEAMRDMLKPAEAPGPTFGEPMTFDDLAGWKDMFADFTSPKTTKAEAGATIERKPKALTPVQNNAFDVFYQHINDVAYLLKTQRDLKMAGEMARSDLFQNKYGKVGQGLILDFLDTFARQGRLGGLRRIPWLDQLRTRTAVGIIGFRVASNLVHASNVAFSIERAGIQNYSAALAEIASGKADDFMHANFAEAFSRGGGEPGLVEAAAKGQSVFGKTIVPKELARASMAGARAIDRINAEATMLGVYFKELRRKGIDPATYKDMPIDKEAQAYAMVLARRAVASPLPKDVPSFISRGTLTGGNISVGKSVGQFQNIFADQWSNIRHDLWRAGIRQADPVKAARMTLAIMGVMALETGIREGVKAGLGALSGKKEKEQDLTGVVLREGIRRFPLGGQATAAILYDSSGVPMIDAFWDPAKETYRSVNAKSPQKQNQHAIRALTGAGQLMGLPVGQLGEIVSDSMAK